MFGPNRFAKKNRAGSPHAAEAKSEQRPRNEHLGIVLREAGYKRKVRDPSDRKLENAAAAVAVREPSGKPSADGRHEQRCRYEDSCLASRDTPGCDEGR